MASNPFVSNNPAQNGLMTSSAAMAFDNLLRRELRVNDPADAQQIAEALRNRYQNDPRAQAITQEAQGLPFLLNPSTPVPVTAAQTSSQAEFQQAIDDVNSDLAALTSSAILKDVTPELQGWASAIRSAVMEGVNAARFALDVRQRDKAFSVRRTLGDYARLARFVGALTPTMSLNYRKLAQSLDEVASVLLVMMGEALASVSFSGGRFLLQAPYSELQTRRDAALYALRNLIGSTQQAYGPNDWPRGLDAYRRLYTELEQQGQGDLRSLLVEGELARMMDILIQRAAHGSAEGLRALGATAQLDLERFRRLAIIGQRLVQPESPPLTAFLQAIQLFADAFNSSGGFRLLRIARPPILFYGLYGIGGLDAADQRLLNLIIQRGLFADQLDCFLNCGCTPENVRCQIILDKILYDVDRAIDLYALGNDNFGEPERRAAAYGFLIDAFNTYNTLPNQQTRCVPANAPLLSITTNIGEQLRPPLTLNDPDILQLARDLVSFGTAVQNRFPQAELLQSRNVLQDLIQHVTDQPQIPQPVILQQLVVVYSRANQAIPPTERVTVPNSLSPYLDILHQELCIQQDMESRWRDLVRTMAPNCVAQDDVFNGLATVIQNAINSVSGEVCEPFAINIPPHFETSLDGLANNILPSGLNRGY